MSDRSSVLVLVHPGSACGSATFNLGSGDARSFREFLARDLNSWEGPILVIDGSFSDELVDYPMLDGAINGALARAAQKNVPSERMMGCDSMDFSQSHAIRALMDKYAFNPADVSFQLTGAWYDPADESGCINNVADVLQGRGFSVDVRDSALEMSVDEASEDEEDDCEFDDAEAPAL